MLTRFKMNAQRYPRLLTLWLTGWVLAAVESCIPRLVGVDARHLLYANAVDFILAFALSGLVYLWILRSAGRTSILTDILDRFEGHQVCTITEHTADETDEEFDETEEEVYEEEPEPEEEDESGNS